MIDNNGQKKMANKIEEEPKISHWKAWRWRIKNSIRTLEKFEYLTGIRFEENDKIGFKTTLNKLPLIHNTLLYLTVWRLYCPISATSFFSYER